MEKTVAELEKAASDPAFWSGGVDAQDKMRTLSRLKEDVQLWRGLEAQAESVDGLVELALEEGDDSLRETLAQETAELTENLDGLELRLALSGEHDRRNAIVAIHAGAGGVESQDWAEMLVRMYLRWAERRGFESSVLDTSPGEEAGIKSAIVQHHRRLRVWLPEEREGCPQARANVTLRRGPREAHLIRAGGGASRG